MYVCVCHVVTDKEVKAAIDAGAHTLAAVIDACCAGGDCGGCHGAIEDMIEARLEASRPSRKHLPVARPRLPESDQLVTER